MSKKANTSRRESMEPTSTLPFAARQCDLPYLDLIKNHRGILCAKLDEHAGPDQAAAVAFAYGVSSVVARVDQIGQVLATVEAYLESSVRGGRPGGPSPYSEFQSALQLIGLCRELIEDAVPNGDEHLENFCQATCGKSGGAG
jgi:hypothetical protein